MLIFFSDHCKFPSISPVFRHVKEGVFVFGKRQPWRDRGKRRERTKKEGERGREMKNKERDRPSFTYPSFQDKVLFTSNLHIEEVATLFPFSSLSHSLSQFLSISSTHTLTFTVALTFSLPLFLSISLSLTSPLVCHFLCHYECV